MNRQYIDDYHIVARYLADQLAEPEREAFEAYLVENPELVRELETAARMKVGLMQLSESGQLGALIQDKPWYRRTQVLAAAASIAGLSLAIALWVVRGPTMQPLFAQSAASITDRLGRPLLVASRHVVVGTRGDADVRIELPDGPATIELTLIPTHESPRYDAVLQLPTEAAGDPLLVKVDRLVPEVNGSVKLFLNAARLHPGLYRLFLSPSDSSLEDVGSRSRESVFLIRFGPSSDRRRVPPR